MQRVLMKLETTKISDAEGAYEIRDHYNIRCRGCLWNLKPLKYQMQWVIMKLEATKISGAVGAYEIWDH